jgi:uncharacterized membrane-anchored protein
VLTDRAPDRTPSDVKVPARIGAAFWLIKLVTTGTGEAASDYLGSTNLVLAGAIGLGGFVTALWWQLRARSYRPIVYWSAVTMVAVFGTMAADAIHQVGTPYGVTTVLWALTVTSVLLWWFRSEGTLSIHSITTQRRERFYWATVLSTFALGTAVGDLVAGELGFGYLDAGLLFLGFIAVPLFTWRCRPTAGVATFWTAYVLTRPLGASFADWFGKPPSNGHGLGAGDGTVTAIGLAAIVCGVAWLRRSEGTGSNELEMGTEPSLSLPHDTALVRD